MAGAGSERESAAGPSQGAHDPVREQVRDGLVVVTGAAGFVGRALVAHLRKKGRRFRVCVRTPPAGAVHDDTVVADLAAASDGTLDALVSGASAVVHLAGRAHVMRETARDPEREYRTANAVVTARLAGAAADAGVARFVLASTVKVNGEATQPNRPFRPDDLPAPHDAYARSKLDAERELLGVCERTTMTPIILRLPLVYGPGVKGNFLTLFDEIARGHALPFGAIRNRRSLLGVGNLIAAIEAALETAVPPRGVHFVADRESVSVPELARAIAAALDVPLRLRAIPVPLLRLAGAVTGRGAMVDRLVDSLEVDASSFRAATGWEPRHTLAEQLAATAQWWRLRHSI